MQQVGTEAFAQAVIERLGQAPVTLAAVRYGAAGQLFEVPGPSLRVPDKKDLVGMDVFVHWAGKDPAMLAARVQNGENGALGLDMITNRGVKVWPDGLPETFCTDHWRCRFLARPDATIGKAELLALLHRLADEDIDFVKTEQLFTFDGEPGYSLGQGQ